MCTRREWLLNSYHGLRPSTTSQKGRYERLNFEVDVAQVWDVQTLECLQTLAGHTGPVRTLVYSGGHMFSGSYDKTVRTSWSLRFMSGI